MQQQSDTANELYEQWMLNQMSQQRQGEEFDLTELWRVIWSGKWLIVVVTILFSVASIFYALSLPNIYKSEALLAPAEQENNGLGGMASQLGSLASFAGVNLGGGGGGIDKTTLALEIMKSRAFVSKFIEKHQLLVPLMASKGWNRDTNELIFNDKLYDKTKNKWIREVDAPFVPRPSAQEAYKEFDKVVSAIPDKASSMITISVEHYSPEVAKQWVDWLIDAINLEMKTRDLTEAQKSISYLESQLDKTKVYKLQEVLYQLIEEQTKTIMFANVREQYAFKTIDPALAPELKDSPKRALICVLGLFLGGVFGIMIVLFRYFVKSKRQ